MAQSVSTNKHEPKRHAVLVSAQAAGRAASAPRKNPQITLAAPRDLATKHTAPEVFRGSA